MLKKSLKDLLQTIYNFLDLENNKKVLVLDYDYNYHYYSRLLELKNLKDLKELIDTLDLITSNIDYNNSEYRKLLNNMLKNARRIALELSK